TQCDTRGRQESRHHGQRTLPAAQVAKGRYSTWRERAEAPSKASCRSSRGDTSARSIGDSFQENRRRFIRGIRGTTNTQQNRRCGSYWSVDDRGPRTKGLGQCTITKPAPVLTAITSRCTGSNRLLERPCLGQA